jgi:hypothetical protein
MNPNQYVMGNTTFYSSDSATEDKKPAPEKTTPAKTTPAKTTQSPNTQTNPPATQPSALSKDWAWLDDPRLKGLDSTEAYRSFALGKGFTGNAPMNPAFKNIRLFGQDPSVLQSAITKQYESRITPKTAQEALAKEYFTAESNKAYNEYFGVTKEGYTYPKNPKIKQGTIGVGGATFGKNTFLSQDYSKRVSKAEGAGAWSLGIDPKDPNAEMLATAWIEHNKGRSDGPGTPWNKILGDGQWGRFDAKMPGLAALKAKYPKASNLALLDAVVRMAHSQAALEPVDDTMKILGPIMVAAGAFLGPAALGAMGSTVSTGAAQAIGGGFMGGLSSGIQSDWDLGATALGAAGGAASGGWNPFTAGGPLSAAALRGISPTNLAINTAIAESANINPHLATALSFGRAGLGGVKTGNWDPLLRKGAAYAFQNYVPGPYGKVGGMLIEQSGKRKS